MIRTGEQFVKGLQDEREVYVNGQLVRDVTQFEPYQGVIAELASLYDMQHDPKYQSLMTYPSPADGAPVSTSFLLATTAEEVQQRVTGESLRTDATYGMMGRLPDYMSAFLADTAAITHVLGRNRPEFAENTVKYWEHCRDNDLALTHTLLDPHLDRSKGVEDQDAMRVVKETSEGLIVEGAKLLSTLAPVSDEIYVGPYMPRKPGEEAYTVCCSIPVATPGLKFLCRESYDTGRSAFDRPLSSRYDEQDAIAVFDNVLIPWDRVFAYGDVDTYNLIAPAFPGYLLLQAAIRGAAKLKFLVGLGSLMAEANGRSNMPRYQEMIGEIALEQEIAEGIVVGIANEVMLNAQNPLAIDDQQSEESFIPGLGTLFGAPGRTALGITAIRIFFPHVHTKAIEMLRLVGSSSLIMTPTEADFANPAARPMLDRFLQGRSGMSAEDRVRIFKLAWDAMGTEFGSRTLHYERFFAGDPINNRILGYNMPRRRMAHDMAQRLIDQLKEEARAAIGK